jgi:hypothetical protein
MAYQSQKIGLDPIGSGEFPVAPFKHRIGCFQAHGQGMRLCGAFRNLPL